MKTIMRAIKPEFMTYDSCIGVIRVAIEDKMIAHVRIGDTYEQFCAWCSQTYGNERLIKEQLIKEASHSRLKKAFDRYFAGKKEEFDLPVKLIGTDFEVKVWRAIADIPWGHTESYAQLAGRIGSAAACRAVGGACGKNPVPIIIPCHRVLTSDNRIGGYSAAGGAVTKRALLELEGVETVR